MKIGMIFECTKDGPDYKVCDNLARRIWSESLGRENLEITPVFMVNKKLLVAGCSTQAALLLQSGVEHVFIFWDLYPSWKQPNKATGKKEKPCRHNDRIDILAKLTEADVHHNKVSLICIERELEAWLIADGSAIERAISTQAHKVTGIKDVKNPDRDVDPKGRLDDIFQQFRRREYKDHIDAKNIIDQIPSVRKLSKSTSFARLRLKIGALPY